MGTYEYSHANGETDTLQEGRWLAEAVLWTTWMHRGELKAESDGQLCLLDAKLFQDTVVAFEPCSGSFGPQIRATEFVNELNKDKLRVTDVGALTENAGGASAASTLRTSRAAFALQN